MARVTVTAVKALNSNNHYRITSSSLLEIIMVKSILLLFAEVKKNRQENEKDIFGLFGTKVITIYNRQ